MKLTVSKEYNDWLVLLEDIVAGRFQPNLEQQGVLNSAAVGWPTCACGQLCNVLPRDADFAPVDVSLRRLGSAFAAHIVNGHFTLALNCFKQIEARSAYLIAEQRKQAEKAEQERTAALAAQAKAEAATRALVEAQERAALAAQAKAEAAMRALVEAQERAALAARSRSRIRKAAASIDAYHYDL